MTRLSVAELKQIADNADPVLRNLRITQSYHELGKELTALIGEGRNTWLGFGVWASKTAGVSIREEELPRLFREALNTSIELKQVTRKYGPVHRLLRWIGIAKYFEHDRVVELADGIPKTVSQQIAFGNQLVFAELAPIFAGLIELFDDEKPHDVDLAGFLAAAKLEGTPEAQQLARSAFLHYGQAISETDPDAKAQLVCLANIEAVLHEQQRLQEPISNALEAPVDDTLVAVTHTHFGQWLCRLGSSAGIVFLRRMLLWPFKELLKEVTALWNAVATRFMMTLKTPGQRLDLGEDVPPPKGSPLFPVELRTIENPQLGELLAKWDRTGGTGRGSGAEDWSSLADRMNYICTLFRSHQLSSDIALPPYNPDQTRALDANRVPDGPL